MKGSYVLLIKLTEGQAVTVGRLGELFFPGGYYAYVGSAVGGLEARINRHLGRDKKRHWHIDYLLEKASVVGVGICEVDGRTECNLARALGSRCDSIRGFGSSDCHCRSHLFFADEEEHVRAAIQAAGKLLNAAITLKEFTSDRDYSGKAWGN